MNFLIEIVLIFGVPGIAAAVAIGSTGKKLAWYAGSAGLAFFVDILIEAGYMLSRSATSPPDQGQKELVVIFFMLLADVLMIARAATTGKRCAACQSRIHPKAIRCPRCQAEMHA
jgi:hypothetical protein